MPEPHDGVAEEAQTVGSDFVRTLGLHDIIAGGLALYIFWLPRRILLANVLPATGKPYLDVPLLICAAAIAGKLIAFAVAFITALTSILLRRWTTNYQALTTQLVESYKRSHLPELVHPERGATAPALTFIARAWPARMPALRRKSANAAFAYTCAVLVCLAPTTTLWTWGALVVFWLLGVLLQLDYVGELARTLAILGGTFPPTGEPHAHTRHDVAR